MQGGYTRMSECDSSAWYMGLFKTSGRRFSLLFFWFLVSCAGVVWGLKFTSVTKTEMNASQGTDAYDATEAFNTYFSAPGNLIIVVAEGTDGAPLLVQDSMDCRADLASFSTGFHDSVLASTDLQACDVTFKSFCTSNNSNAVVQKFLAKTFFNTAHRTTLLEVKVSTSCDPKVFRTQVQAAIDANKIDSLDVEATGGPALLGAVQQGVADTMGLSTKTFPIALLLVAVVVGNVRVALCILLCIGACFLTSFLIMYPIACSMAVTTMTPTLMIAAILAMSIDYSLFLLTRFRDEINAGREVFAAVQIMLQTSGRIVLVSGGTLTACFLTMLLLPSQFVSTMGIGASVSVLLAILCNLTITPALLLSCPGFFTSNKWYGFSTEGCCCARRPPEPQTFMGAVTYSHSFTPLAKRSKEQHADTFTKSCWYPLARATQRWGAPLLLLVVAAAVPACLHLGELKFSEGTEDLMPRGLGPTVALATIQADFGSSTIFPTSLLLVPPAGVLVNHSHWLQEACHAIQFVANATDTPVTNFSGIVPTKNCDAPPLVSLLLLDLDGDAAVWLPAFCEVKNCSKACRSFGRFENTCDSACALVEQITAGNQTLCDEEGLALLSSVEALEKGYVSEDKKAVKLSVRLSGDPFNSEGQDWINNFRSASEPYAADHPAVGRMYLYGQGAIQMDSAQAVFEAFPTMIGITFGIVFVIIGISSWSLMVPLRAVLCLSLMLGATFGLSVLVYQQGLLDGLGWASVGKEGSGALYWLSPIIAFSVMVGLGLDYDIFLMERISEERRSGLSDSEAVMAGLCYTGNLISIAGVVMLLAFGSLLLSATPALNQIAFLLLIGIIIDCFVTTKIIIPSAMSLLGTANFWPTKLPITRTATSVDLDKSSIPAGCRIFCCKRT